MTKEELLKKIDFEKSWLYECGIFGSDVDIAFHAIKKSVIEALEQEPCEDAISREATLNPYNGLNDEDTVCVWLIRKNIEQQPSIILQKPKTDILDKIRAEIETERNEGCHTWYAGGLDFALSIIDKYKEGGAE